ncbi:hypothetical protein N2152v2_009719 [Parachlorella kessleri]
MRLVLAGAASGGGSPEQPIAPRPASGAHQPPTQQLPLDAWEQARQQVAAFQRQHGRMPRASADAQGPLLTGERPLGVWCTEQQRRKAGSKAPPLSAEERKALLGIPGWSWWASKQVHKPWERRRQEVAAFYQRHGRLPRATAGKPCPFLPGEKELGKWLNRQRQLYKGNLQPPLSAEQIAALEATPGWACTPWEQQRQQVEAFYQQHGRFPRTTAGKASPLLPGEEELGRWVKLQRQCFKGNMQPALSAERIAGLEATSGWVWEECLPWELRYQQVQDFVRQHSMLPRKKIGMSNPILSGGNGLSTWCDTQRQRFKGHQQPPLTAEQQAALAALPGWFWDVADDRWEQQRRRLEAFVLMHGRLPRVRSAKEPPLEGEHELACWLKNQRQRERGTCGYTPLTAKQQAALKATPLWYGEVGL